MPERTAGCAVRAPASPAEWDAYYDLRWRVLRAPWGQPPGSERDETEAACVHRMVCGASGTVLAVGRLHAVDATTAQIRYMAVEPACQGRGLGTLLLEALESAALERGRTRILLHARESALGFYRRRGYRLIGPSHRLFGDIQHFLMTRELDVDPGSG